jgi:uncharacterized protein YjiS (DUF1127 family)
MNGFPDRTAFTDLTDTANLRALRSIGLWRLGRCAGRVLALGAVDLVCVWRTRRQVRRVLRDFSDLELMQIGLTRADALAEVCKPFWRR